MIVGALKKAAGVKAEFVSRGDKSGTHAELRYWKAAGVDNHGKAAWYARLAPAWDRRST